MTTAQVIIVAVLYLTSVFFGTTTILMVIDSVRRYKTSKGLGIFKNAIWNDKRFCHKE